MIAVHSSDSITTTCSRVAIGPQETIKVNRRNRLMFRVMQQRITDFPDRSNVDTDSSESLISQILWQWRFSSPEVRDQLIRDMNLDLTLEFWFPFHLIEHTRKLGTWCDGIVLLEIDDIHRTAFRIAGVGYFPQNLAPFEVEFHYQNRRDLLTSKIALRFTDSWLANKPPITILERRPRTDVEWTVAVELTPE